MQQRHVFHDVVHMMSEMRVLAMAVALLAGE